MRARENMNGAVTRPDAGFGLVGVIVALVLLSVGVLSVSSVLTQSVSMQTVSSQREHALFIAQTTMEGIRAMDPLTVTAQATTAVNEDGQPDPNGIYTRTVAVGAASTDLISVTVVVTAPRSRPMTLVTWIYDGT